MATPARIHVALVAMALATVPAVRAHAFHLEESLQNGTTAGHAEGGSFGPDGWTFTALTDRLWFAIPSPCASGSIAFTMSNVTNASLFFDPSWGGGDNDIFAMYDDAGLGEPLLYRPQLVGNNYRVWLRIRNEPGNYGTQKLNVGLCPAADSSYHDGTCPCGTFFDSDATGGDGTWDGTPQRLRVEFGGGVVRFLRNGNEVDRVDYSASGYAWGPQEMHFSLGSPRTRAGSGVPLGAVFSNLIVDTVDSTAFACSPVAPPDAGPPPDAPASCDPARAVTAVSLAPTGGSGSAQVFHAVYEDCLGASNFRVEQINVWDAVSGTVPVVGAGYEAGMLYNEAGSCVPGEARVLTTDYGALDCSQSRVTVSGNQVAIDWALSFNARFVGTHGVWFDAKGFPDPGGPRLGWTQMGTFTVIAPDAGFPTDSGFADVAPSDVVVSDAGGMTDSGVAMGDAGVVMDAQTHDAGTSQMMLSACGCSTPGHANHTPRALWFALAGIATFGRRRRGSSRRPHGLLD